MLPFIRSDLVQFTAYKPHPSSDTAQNVQASIQIDRLDTNESPYDLPPELKEKLAWTYQQLIQDLRKETRFLPKIVCLATKYERRNRVSSRWCVSPIIETNRYPDGGHQTLKSAIAEYVNESAHFRLSVFTPSHISVGLGSDEQIQAFSQHSALQVWQSATDFVYLRLKPNNSHSQHTAVKNIHAWCEKSTEDCELL